MGARPSQLTFAFNYSPLSLSFLPSFASGRLKKGRRCCNRFQSVGVRAQSETLPGKSTSTLVEKVWSDLVPQISRRQFCVVIPWTLLSASLLPPPKSSEPAQIDFDNPSNQSLIFTRTSSGLEYHDYRVGSGPKPTIGTTCYIRWTGRLVDRFGWPFERQGIDENDELLKIELGKDNIIKGLEQGLMTMRCGGKRRLYVPGRLGYTNQEVGPVPRRYGDKRRLYATVLNNARIENAGDLVIDVEIVKCKGPIEEVGQ